MFKLTLALALLALGTIAAAATPSGAESHVSGRHSPRATCEVNFISRDVSLTAGMAMAVEVVVNDDCSVTERTRLASAEEREELDALRYT